MYVCSCKIQFLLPSSNSLKDKRKIVKSVIERLRYRFPLAVAEVNFLDSLGRCEIGLAGVSNQYNYLEEILQKSITFLENDYRIEIINIEKKFY